MPAVHPAQPTVRRMGRYALYRKIASGGMATLYFGRLLGHSGFARTVAVKLLHPQFAQDPSSRRCSSTRRGWLRASGVPTSSPRWTSCPRTASSPSSWSTSTVSRSLHSRGRRSTPTRPEVRRCRLTSRWRLPSLSSSTLAGAAGGARGARRGRSAARHRAPRRVTAEHPGGCRRPHAPHRLRGGQGNGPAADDARGPAQGKAGVHGAGTTARRAGHSPQRPLRGVGGALGDAGGKAPVPRGRRRRHGDACPSGGGPRPPAKPPATIATRRGASHRATGCRGDARPRSRSREALRDRARHGRRARAVRRPGQRCRVARGWSRPPGLPWRDGPPRCCNRGRRADGSTSEAMQAGVVDGQVQPTADASSISVVSGVTAGASSVRRRRARWSLAAGVLTSAIVTAGRVAWRGTGAARSPVETAHTPSPRPSPRARPGRPLRTPPAASGLGGSERRRIFERSRAIDGRVASGCSRAVDRRVASEETPRAAARRRLQPAILVGRPGKEALQARMSVTRAGPRLSAVVFSQRPGSRSRRWPGRTNRPTRSRLVPRPPRRPSSCASTRDFWRHASASFDVPVPGVQRPFETTARSG